MISCISSDGRMASSARLAAGWEDGERSAGSCAAPSAHARRRPRREHSSRGPANRSASGSRRSGISPTRSTELAPLACRGSWASGGYETAWTWLHKLRRAMVRPGRERLSGAVEVDETFLGGEGEEIAGRGTDRVLIAIAAEIRGRGTGRIRMERVDDASARSLVPFVERTVVGGSVIHTDGWSGYVPLPRSGYEHRPKSLRASRQPAHVAMPRVHRVAALLKRWWLGTYHGGISDPHLEYYLDEFTFRFNRRTSKARGLLFYRLLQQAVQVDAIPYHHIRGGDHYP